MYIIKHGRFFSHQLVRMLVVVIVLIAVCDACGSRRSPPSRRPPPPPTPSRKKTKPPIGNPSGTPFSSPSVVSSASPSEIPSSTPSASPSENYFCFSTSIQNLTYETIAAKLEGLAYSGNFSLLFNDGAKEQNVFLKYLPPSNTGCSNIQGYMIVIRRNNDTNYEYDIAQLDQKSATEHCGQAQNCIDSLLFSAEGPNPTDASSIQTKETDKPTSTKSDGINTEHHAAGKSGDDGVSSTTIVIPVTVVVLLVIVVVIIALWFKRRSERKGYKQDKTPERERLRKMLRVVIRQNSVNHVAGPLNGDVYTVVNPSAENSKNGKSDNNDMVYTELSHMKSGKSVDKHPDPQTSQQAEYADIAHILTAGAETTYENVTPQSDEKEAYANVIALP